MFGGSWKFKLESFEIAGFISVKQPALLAWLGFFGPSNVAYRLISTACHCAYYDMHRLCRYLLVFSELDKTTLPSFVKGNGLAEPLDHIYCPEMAVVERLCEPRSVHEARRDLALESVLNPLKPQQVQQVSRSAICTSKITATSG